jgi:hypothetical protein
MMKSEEGCLPQRQLLWSPQGSGSFPGQKTVADPPDSSAACRRRAATPEDQMVPSITVLRGTGFKGMVSPTIETDRQVVFHSEGRA